MTYSLAFLAKRSQKDYKRKKSNYSTLKERIKRFVQVLVRDNNVDQAMKALKKKMQREGIFRELKMRRHYLKPSEQRVLAEAEAARRLRKALRKRFEREGY